MKRAIQLAAFACLCACRSTPPPAADLALPADRRPHALPDQQGPVIGAAEPLDRTPYSKWEHVEHSGLLEANGVAADRASWRSAVGNPSPVLRAAACGLLAEAPEADDRAALTTAVGDADASVRAWAALGLVRLGDDRRRSALRALAAKPATSGDPGALVAAGALARLGDGSGLLTVAAALEHAEVRMFAVKWLFDFARVPGADVWPLYARALRDPAETVRGVALAQLGELRDPRAVPLLEAFVADNAAAAGQLQVARALLAELRR